MVDHSAPSFPLPNPTTWQNSTPLGQFNPGWGQIAFPHQGHGRPSMSCAPQRALAAAQTGRMWDESPPQSPATGDGSAQAQPSSWLLLESASSMVSMMALVVASLRQTFPS